MATGKAQTVLVVEDEASIASFVSLYLKNAGYSVKTAATGADALQHAGAGDVALIILDLMLPDVDGIEVCRRLRKTSDVPILMLTARDEDVDKIIGLEVGADDYMTKPFSPRELVLRIQSVLRRSAPPQRRPEVIERGDLRIDLAARQVFRGGDEVRLTPTEFNLLLELAQLGEDRAAAAVGVRHRPALGHRREQLQHLREAARIAVRVVARHQVADALARGELRQRLVRTHDVQVDVGPQVEEGENLVQHLPMLRGRETTNDDGRPVGLYIARFRNITDKDSRFMRGYGFQGGSGCAAFPSYASTLPGFGASLKSRIRELYPAPISIGGFGEVLARYENSVDLDPNVKDAWGIPALRFNYRFGENELAMARDMVVTAEEMLRAAGCENITVTRDPLPEGWSIHELGTARMGTDPKTSVTNGFGQTHDVKNLFIVDGSTFVSAGCQNPTWTILALAWRASDYMLEEARKGNL